MADTKTDVKTKDVKTVVVAAAATGADDSEEEILKKSDDRYVLFPIRYPDLYRFFKQAQAMFWTVEELNIGGDLKDWNAMTDNERYFIKHVLAFFAASDLIVMQNLSERFTSEVTIPEARCFYAAQEHFEAIHSEVYALFLHTYVSDQAEKAKLFNAITTFPAIKRKADWAKKWMSSDRPFAERLVAFAAVEGIGFCGSFCAIFWLKKRNKMPALATANEYIQRDESSHVAFATALFHYLKRKPDQTTVANIVSSAVDAEIEYICESLPCDLLGMNSKSMAEYIKFVADRLIDDLGYEKIYKNQNPFDWATSCGFSGKTNFFEKTTTEYARAGIMEATKNRLETMTEKTIAAASSQPSQTKPKQPTSFLTDLDC
jgi:ribonucleoside-diphosphate reductase subunit M2